MTLHRNTPIRTTIALSLLVTGCLLSNCSKNLSEPEETERPGEQGGPGDELVNTITPGDFTIAVLGDTQYYTENTGTNNQYIRHFEDQVQWIREHRADSNIVYVASVGDITENYDHTDPQTENQWIRASETYAMLEADNIPFGVVPGDHDIAYSSPWHASAFYKEYFGASRFSGRDYYQGDYPTGLDSNVNHYDFISAGETDLMFVYLRWHDDTEAAGEACDWAYDRIAGNPGRKAIVITHYTVASGDTDYDGKQDWGKQSSGSPSGQAENIYNRLKTLPNFLMMLGGHVKHEGRRQDTYQGSTVHSFTQNYQGNIYEPGLLRTIRFSPENDLISVATFIPGQPPLNSEKSTFTKPWHSNITTARTCDFNNDGRSETSFFNQGVWTAGDMAEVTYGTGSADIPVPGDYNGDGKTDIAVFRPGNPYCQWLRPGRDAVTFGQAEDIPTQGDYDGNGTTDLSFFRPSEGKWYVYHDYLPSPHYTTQVYGQPDDIPVPADYDGDGKVDYALFRPSTAEWLRFDIHRGQYGYPGDIPVPGDYNGDGIAERSVYRPGTNQWFVYGNSVPLNIGQPGDIPVPGDYNGDGMTDKAVYRPSDGTVYLEDGSTVTTDNAGGIPLNLPYAVWQHFFN
ncbi:hypothetical protein [Sinomicrobium soli]|uniref:hypothetical protein n=1 Tax=Sinomicrobium sp. N-1-3-6 TaxID=2219864 RepID=UPI000DCCA563|nr:hypothetical protein [Sinomicrobium sp. N-1-3-6]RAV30463.1 hypothetical protein DN748_02865 [Sinomicrobium sp. N-1-3-6]